MHKELIETAKQKWSIVEIIIFTTLIFFWFLINFGYLNSGINKQIWAASYQILALIGGVLGIFYSKLWGGTKSYIGRGILLLSIGLLLQCFGQSVYSYFIFYKHIDIPYPSIGDIGFFGSVVMYIWAIAQFAKASGVSLHSKYFKNKITVFIFPLILLVASYLFFLKGYIFEGTSPLKIFLDFGYPLGEAIYVSIALVALLFCRQLLGGLMKKPIMFLIIAFIFQYISDFTFLFQSNHGTWRAGGINDLMYSISYLIMTIGVVYIGKTFFKIKEGN